MDLETTSAQTTIVTPISVPHSFIWISCLGCASGHTTEVNLAVFPFKRQDRMNSHTLFTRHTFLTFSPSALWLCISDSLLSLFIIRKGWGVALVLLPHMPPFFPIVVISVTVCKLWSHRAGTPHPPSLPPALDMFYSTYLVALSALSLAQT